MRRHTRHLAKIAGLTGLACWGCIALAQPPPEDPGRTFVACPVYRDTNSGRKSGCWLAVNPVDGVRYDISLGRTKPQIGHQVLVEGRLETLDQPRQAGSACGGVVLRPVVVSVLEATCRSFMLPAESYPGRRFVLDLKAVLPPADVVESIPPPPYPPRTWSIEFSFGSDFLQYQYSEIILDEIGRYIRASRPRRIEVIGYAVTAPRWISGERLAESPQLARGRAETVALALRRLGATRRLLQVKWRDNPSPLSDKPGLAEPSRRRVDVRLLY
ncbi:MAG TPA: hypothetical protein VIC29_19435 [Steroidobacteraceae bacterium]|jgi:hypothetical protein